MGPFYACKKKTDNKLYQVNAHETFPTNTGKNKLKTESQYISILYANLFQEALSANELVEVIDCIESIGDRETAHEIVISNFMTRPGIVFPTNAEMRADIDKFLDDTYKRFFVRDLSEAERTWFKTYIQNNPNVTPELVFFAFTLSNEYLYY